MRSKLFAFSIVLMSPAVLAEVQGQETAAPLQSVYLDSLRYQQYLHSRSENTEMGEDTVFDMISTYRFNEESAMKLRLEIDPNRGAVDNKTPKVNLRLVHKTDRFDFQGDLLLKGDDYGRGATTVGLDSTSKYSWMAFQATESLRFTFFPYNMGTEIGREFRTWDVARLYYIAGTPSYVSNLPVQDEVIKTKTTPGFELQWKPNPRTTSYVALGSASFAYPNTPGFDLEQNAAAERWALKEDRAYKAGLSYKDETMTLLTEYATHNKARESGALLEKAVSFQASYVLSNLVFDFERTFTKAGSNAYRLRSDFSWFDETTPFRPVYSDYFGEKQDWLGKWDSASLYKTGYKLGEWTPFIAYKTLGQYFIDRERESAQRLRTADESASHGGLKIVVLGTDYKAGRFNFRPEVQFLRANNAVFGNRLDQREDRILSELNKTDTWVRLTTSYSL